MTVTPGPPVGKVTFRAVVASLLAVIVVLLGAIWFEIWSTNNLSKDLRCESLEYDLYGERQESLNAAEQRENDIIGCGLDLPLNEDDSGF